MTTQNPAPAEAQSRRSESVIAQARALEPTIRELLQGINAVLDSRPEAEPARVTAGCHPQDRTDNRIRAYVASIRPLKGVDYPEAVDADHQRGRSLIERLALSAENGDLPKLRLTGEQVADVLSFIASSEPVEPKTWWRDPKDGPSHLVGFYLLLQALEESLRGASEQPPAEESDPPIESASPAPVPGDVPAIPVSLFEDDLHERLMNAAGIVGTVRNALDDDCTAEHDALSVAVSMLHKIDDELDTACWKAIQAWDLAHPDHPEAIERRRILEGMRPTEESAS